MLLRSAGNALSVALATSLVLVLLTGCSGAAKNPQTPSATASTTPTAPAGTKAATSAVAPEPVTERVELKPVTTPPEATVAMIEPKVAEAGSKYAVVFVPYGQGPGAAAGGRLVISVSESKPAAGVKKPYDFVGRNVLVDTSRLAAGSKITKGGTYAGTLVLTEEGGLLVPRLTEAKAR